MQKILITLLALFSAMAALAAPDKKSVLKAIAVIESSHDGESIANAIPIVMRFAEESPDVLLLASEETMPWILEDLKLGEDRKAAVHSLLLASYAAGSIKQQLASGKLDQNPYAGWLLALAKYEELKQKLGFISPGMEKLSALQKSGRLQAFAEEVAKRNDAHLNASRTTWSCGAEAQPIA